MNQKNLFHGGKYGPGILYVGMSEAQLSILNNGGYWPHEKWGIYDFKRNGRPYHALRGKFWIGGKETPCFTPQEDGGDCLLVQEWIMSTRDYDLTNLPFEKVWSKCTYSNNGRTGYLYVIAKWDDVSQWL